MKKKETSVEMASVKRDNPQMRISSDLGASELVGESVCKDSESRAKYYLRVVMDLVTIMVSRV